jgi:hypothetical protein
LLSQYCKASHFFFANFYVPGGGATVRFAPVVPWVKTGPGHINPVQTLQPHSLKIHFNITIPRTTTPASALIKQQTNVISYMAMLSVLPLVIN